MVLVALVVSHQMRILGRGSLAAGLASTFRGEVPVPSPQPYLVPCAYKRAGIVVQVGYRGRRWFLLDTGSTETLVRPSLSPRGVEEVSIAEARAKPATDLPDSFFTQLSKAMGVRVDGLIGVDILADRLLGLDPVGRCVAVFSNRSFEEASALWFDTVIVNDEHRRIALPWSARPLMLLSTGTRTVRTAVAARQTVRLRSSWLGDEGRLWLSAHTPARSWAAILDTGSTLTLVPQSAGKDLPGKPITRLTSSGVGLVRPTGGSLSLGVVGLSGLRLYSPSNPRKDDVAVVGLDVLSRFKSLIDFASGGLELGTYDSSGKAEAPAVGTSMFHLPSRQWIVFGEKIDFPYEDGWYLLSGRAVVRKGRIYIN